LHHHPTIPNRPCCTLIVTRVAPSPFPYLSYSSSGNKLLRRFCLAVSLVSVFYAFRPQKRLSCSTEHVVLLRSLLACYAILPPSLAPRPFYGRSSRRISRTRYAPGRLLPHKAPGGDGGLGRNRRPNAAGVPLGAVPGPCGAVAGVAAVVPPCALWRFIGSRLPAPSLAGGRPVPSLPATTAGCRSSPAHGRSRRLGRV
jgi:hypothetical protein